MTDLTDLINLRYSLLSIRTGQKPLGRPKVIHTTTENQIIEI